MKRERVGTIRAMVGLGLTLGLLSGTLAIGRAEARPATGLCIDHPQYVETLVVRIDALAPSIAPGDFARIRLQVSRGLESDDVVRRAGGARRLRGPSLTAVSGADVFLWLQGQTETYVASGITNVDGVVVLTTKIPATTADDAFNVQVFAQRIAVGTDRCDYVTVVEYGEAQAQNAITIER